MLVFPGFWGPDRSFCPRTSAGTSAWKSAGHPAPKWACFFVADFGRCLSKTPPNHFPNMAKGCSLDFDCLGGGGGGHHQPCKDSWGMCYISGTRIIHADSWDQQFTYGRVFAELFSANSCEISKNFPMQYNVFFADFREFSAEFLQTFCKNPFANDTITELLIGGETR